METKWLYDRWAEICDGINLWSRRFWALGVALTIVGGLAAALVHRLSNATWIAEKAELVVFLAVFWVALPNSVVERWLGPPRGHGTKAWIRYAARCLGLLCLLVLGKALTTGMILNLFALFA